MQNRDFIKLAKEEYKKIGYVECPAFSGEKIYFTNKGLTHLLYKNGNRRHRIDYLIRLRLLVKVPDIIKNATKYSEYRKDGNAQFWSLEKYIGDKLITIIVFQKGNGNKYFLSVMKSTKTS